MFSAVAIVLESEDKPIIKENMKSDHSKFWNKEQNEKMIDQDTQETAAWIDALSEKKEEKELAGAEIIDEWNDLEKQRDIAFKIMYFFIVFIIFTFTLLYVFFRMTQQQQEEEARRKGVKAREGAHQETFLDFLAGQTDNEHYVVNPYARHSATKITSFPTFFPWEWHVFKLFFNLRSYFLLLIGR